DVRRLGRIGGKTIGYFLLSSALSVALGLTLVNVFEPGGGIDDATREHLLSGYGADAAALGSRKITVGVDLLVEIVPRNPFRAAADMDMLSLIFFALVFGAALTLIPRDRAE